MGQCLEALGRDDEAAEAYRQAIAADAQVIRDLPATTVHWRPSPSPLYDAFIALQERSGSRAEVEALLRSQLPLWEQLQAVPNHKCPSQLRQLELQLRLAESLWRSKQEQEAEKRYRDAIATLEQLIEGDDRQSPNKALILWAKLRPAQEKVVLHADSQQAESVEGTVDSHLARGMAAARQAVHANPAHQPTWDGWTFMALAYYRSRDWQGADADTEQALELVGGDPSLMHNIAPLLLLAGNEDRYRQMCRPLLDRWQQWSGQDLAAAAALCTLCPQPADNIDRLLELNHRAIEEGPECASEHLARAYIRAREHEQAIKHIGSVEPPKSLFDLAIAHHLAGRPTEARKWLKKARNYLEDWDTGNPRLRLECEVLRQEAEQLIAYSDADLPGVAAK